MTENRPSSPSGQSLSFRWAGNSHRTSETDEEPVSLILSEHRRAEAANTGFMSAETRHNIRQLSLAPASQLTRLLLLQQRYIRHSHDATKYNHLDVIAQLIT